MTTSPTIQDSENDSGKFKKFILTDKIGLIIRFLQFILSIIILGLAAYTVSSFRFGANIWSLIVSIISLIYLSLILGFSFFNPNYLNVGAIVIMEGSLMVFFFTSFISQAAEIGSAVCSGEFDSFFYYSFSFNSTPCKTGKAVIAFNAINWVLYLATFVAFLVNIIVPLSKKSNEAVFQWSYENEVQLNHAILNANSFGNFECDRKSLDEEQTAGGIEHPHTVIVIENNPTTEPTTEIQNNPTTEPIAEVINSGGNDNSDCNVQDI